MAVLLYGVLRDALLRLLSEFPAFSNSEEETAKAAWSVEQRSCTTPLREWLDQIAGDTVEEQGDSKGWEVYSNRLRESPKGGGIPISNIKSDPSNIPQYEHTLIADSKEAIKSDVALDCNQSVEQRI